MDDTVQPAIRGNRVGGKDSRRPVAKDGQATVSEKPTPIHANVTMEAETTEGSSVPAKPQTGAAVSAAAQIAEPATSGRGEDDGGTKHLVEGGTESSGRQKPKCFDDAQLEPSPDDPTGISLTTSHPRVVQAPEMRKLVRDIFAVEHVIRLLFRGEKYKLERKQFFEGLLTTARIGLCGTDYEIEAGQVDLSLTQDEIADAFPLLRDELWKSYFSIVASSTLIFVPLGCFVYYYFFVQHVFADHNGALLAALPAFRQICLALVLIPLGVPIGIFVEFVFRVGEKTTYDGLLAINPGRWKPWKRTATTLITAYVFAFIVGVGAFQIGIGGLLLNDFVSTQPWLSIAVGFVTGFTYPYVRDIVTQFKPERRDAAPPNGGANTSRGNSDKKGKG